MTDTTLVCGKGAACEAACPVMLIGRMCPDLPTFLDEVAALMTDASATPQLEPQPV